MCVHVFFCHNFTSKLLVKTQDYKMPVQLFYTQTVHKWYIRKLIYIKDAGILIDFEETKIIKQNFKLVKYDPLTTLSKTKKLKILAS